MNNINLYRAKIGLSQKEVADCIGITRTNFIYIEKGFNKIIKADYMQKMCDLFKTTPCMLLGKDNFKYFPETDSDIDYMISILQNAKEKK